MRTIFSETTTKFLPNIALGKDGLPQNWKNWDKYWREAYLEKVLYGPMRKRGIDVKKMIEKAISDALFASRVRAAVKKKTLDNPAFFYDLEWKVGQAMEAYLRRKALGVRPIVKAPVRRPL